MQTEKMNSFVLCHLSFVLFLSFFLFLFSCQRSTAPVYNPQKLQLTVADVSCTEAWLRLKTERTEKAENENDLVLQVFRDDSLVVNKNWGAGDSLVYLDGLQPNTSYAFSAKLLQDNKLLAASPKVTATTMDTTSHDFTWQTYKFGGEGGSSSFYDVAIIDENDIWAVGEIYTADDKYNAAHWNGEKWELKRIKTKACGGVEYPPILSVFNLADRTIIFGHTDGSLTFLKNQNYINDCSLWYKVRGTAKKIWGISKKDFYVVGYNGFIANYDGKTWQRIKSGTNLPVQDIWGAVNKETGKYEILCVASNEYNNHGKKIIKIENKKATFIQDEGLPWSLRSIWFIPSTFYYVCGDGIYINKFLKNEWEDVSSDFKYYTKRIRGINSNDIFVCGAFGLIAHFNGLHWYHYLNTELPEFNGAYYSLDYKKDIVVTVGDKLDQSINTKAVILVGKKTNK